MRCRLTNNKGSATLIIAMAISLVVVTQYTILFAYVKSRAVFQTRIRNASDTSVAMEELAKLLRQGADVFNVNNTIAGVLTPNVALAANGGCPAGTSLYNGGGTSFCMVGQVGLGSNPNPCYGYTDVKGTQYCVNTAGVAFSQNTNASPVIYASASEKKNIIWKVLPHLEDHVLSMEKMVAVLLDNEMFFIKKHGLKMPLFMESAYASGNTSISGSNSSAGGGPGNCRTYQDGVVASTVPVVVQSSKVTTVTVTNPTTNVITVSPAPVEVCQGSCGQINLCPIFKNNHCSTAADYVVMTYLLIK